MVRTRLSGAAVFGAALVVGAVVGAVVAVERGLLDLALELVKAHHRELQCLSLTLIRAGFAIRHVRTLRTVFDCVRIVLFRLAARRQAPGILTAGRVSERSMPQRCGLDPADAEVGAGTCSPCGPGGLAGVVKLAPGAAGRLVGLAHWAAWRPSHVVGALTDVRGAGRLFVNGPVSLGRQPALAAGC